MNVREVSRERPRGLNTGEQIKWYQHKGVMMQKAWQNVEEMQELLSG